MKEYLVPVSLSVRVNYILRVPIIGTEHLVVHLEKEISKGIHSSVSSLFAVCCI